MSEKYNEYQQTISSATAILNAAIMKAIRVKDAIDTSFMLNNTFVQIEIDGSTKEPTGVTIDTTEYFKYVDEGTVHITPREITKYFSELPEFNREIGKVYTAWLEWQIQKELS